MHYSAIRRNFPAGKMLNGSFATKSFRHKLR